jgi:arylsulfatase A-like enzyme
MSQGIVGERPSRSRIGFPLTARDLLQSLLWAFCVVVIVGFCVGLATSLRSFVAHEHARHQMYNLALQVLAQELTVFVLWACVAVLPVALVLVMVRWWLASSTYARVLERSTRSRWLRILASVAVVSLSSLHAYVLYQRTFTAPEGPNVLLVVIDTLRADHLGAYGYEGAASPNLDALARESHLFRNAFSASSWTRPAIASIVSSKLPTEHGITAENRSQRLAAGFVTIQEYLRQRNYRTVALTTNPHLHFGLVQNFEKHKHWGNGKADRVYGRALRWLDKHRDERFFLLIHNNDPHDSYEYHPGFTTTPWNSPYRLVKNLMPTRGEVIRFDGDVEGEVVVLDDRQLAEMKGNYDGEIRFLDHHFGRLIHYLRAWRLLDDTIVIVTADHGEEFLDHGAYWHGGTLYNELIRVPLIVRVPGFGSGSVEERVTTLDIFPTLVELLGGSAQQDLRFSGRSLIPLLSDGQRIPEPILSVSAFRGPLKYSLIDGDYKLIRHASGEIIGLFDLRTDPGETTDLSGTHTDELKRIDARLTALVGDAVAVSAGSPGPVDLDDATRDELEALGYLAE